LFVGLLVSATSAALGASGLVGSKAATAANGQKNMGLVGSLKESGCAAVERKRQKQKKRNLLPEANSAVVKRKR